VGQVAIAKPQCAGCGHDLDEDPGAPVETRDPCPICGSLVRHIAIHVEDTIAIHESTRVQGRPGTGGKPFVDQIVGDDLQRSTGRWMRRERVIDRTNDRYREVVTDPTTGEVVHECEEPLTDHQGHGHAKRKPT
jgi:hypothetical protein